MSIIKLDYAEIKSKEPQTETVLWTNPSPDADFAAQTISLSQDITNFNYIGFYVKGYKGNSNDMSASNNAFYMMPVSEWRKMSKIGNNAGCMIIAGYESTGGRARETTYISDASMAISAAWKLNASGNNNAYAIPYKIVGL